MKKFQVTLAGENLFLAVDGSVQRHGLFTTRFLEATDGADAERVAIEMVRDDLVDVILNEATDPPQITVEKIRELLEFPADRHILGSGYFWYPASA